MAYHSCNDSSAHGGAVHAFSSGGSLLEITIEDSDLNDNVATGNGGALYAEGAAVQIVHNADGTFQSTGYDGNSATDGGAVR